MGKLIASAKSNGSTPPIPEGVYQGVCYQIVDIGTQEIEWKGEKKLQRKVLISWEIPEERIELERDGKKENLPRVVSKEYTLTLGEKANLRKDLEAWRGRRFTETELDAFDLSNLLGVGVQIQIVHKVSGEKTYANVSTLMRLPKGAATPKPENPTLCYSLDEAGPGDTLPAVPNWIQTKIAASIEWKALASQDGLVTAGEHEVEDLPPMDDISF